MDRFDTPRTAQNVALLVRVRFHFLLPLAPTPPRPRELHLEGLWRLTLSPNLKTGVRA